MYKILLIIHLEEGASCYYAKVNRKLWFQLRNMESRRMATYKEEEFDLLERIQLGKTEFFKTEAQIFIEDDLSIMHAWLNK